MNEGLQAVSDRTSEKPMYIAYANAPKPAQDLGETSCVRCGQGNMRRTDELKVMQRH